MQDGNAYQLRFTAYCGMRTLDETYTDRHEARQEAAEFIRYRRRQGFEVMCLEPGSRWEVLEPEDCAMVPDECGTITLSVFWED